VTDERIEERARGRPDAGGDGGARDAVHSPGDARARTRARPINTPAETA
jgi:hypothetical protein